MRAMSLPHPRTPHPEPVHVRDHCDRCRMRLAHPGAADAVQCPICPATISGNALALAFLAASKPERGQ
jgi:hypothetical protein